MNHLFKVLFVALFLFAGFYSYAQKPVSVTIEGEMTPEEKRIQKVRDRIRELEKPFSVDKQKFDNLNNNIRRTGSFSNLKKEDILDFISRCNKALGFATSKNLNGRFEQIATLKESINLKGRSGSFNDLIKNIKRFKAKANNGIDLLEKKDKDIAIEKIKDKNLKVDLDNLENESKRLDELLKKSTQKLEKQSSKKKFKNIDDFFNSKKSTKNGQSFSKKFADKNKKKFFSKKTSSKSFSKKFNIKTDEKEGDSFEIEKQGDYTGVISSKGKILIPYKKWEVINYKYGIAEVKLVVARKSICNTSLTVYKTGFVDSTGEFIEGFNIDVSENKMYTNNNRAVLTLTAVYKENYSISQLENSRRRSAYKRNQDIAAKKYERRKKREAKEREIKNKKCRIEINTYKSNALYKYK